MAVHLQQALHDLVAKAFGPEWRVMRTLLKNWKDIVGEDLSRFASPTGLKPVLGIQGRETTKLYVSIPGALAPQFKMQEHVMLERINQILGYGYVTAIIFEHQIAAPDETRNPPAPPSSGA